MSILDTIKNFFKTEEEPEPEVISFNQLKPWMKEKEEINQGKTVEIMEFFEENISILIENLEKNIETLKKINLDEKKTEERAKFIIKQNLDYYIINLEKLINSLKNTKIQEPNILIKNIDSIFLEFNKKSETNFQKATFLIGKELQETKDSIENFFKNIKKYLDKNKDLLKIQKTISGINNKLNELKELEKTNQDINSEIENQGQKINTLKEQIKKNKFEIEIIKDSEEYNNEIKTKQEIINKNQELKKESLDLKESIDFKTLTSFFHSNQKEMDLIKKFQKNFMETFEENNSEALINLLTDAKIKTIKIKQKIESLSKIKQEIKDLEKDFNQKGDANILIKESEINKKNQDIDKIDYEITRRRRKTEKTNDKKQEIINNIKLDLGKINIGMVEDKDNQKENKKLDNEDNQENEYNQENKKDNQEDEEKRDEDDE